MPTSDPTDATANLISGGGSYVPPVSTGTGRSGGKSGSRSSEPSSEPAKSVDDKLTPQGSERYLSGVELGRGGWGHVERARDKQLDRDVAVKRINRELANAASIHDRFFQEALVTGQLQHPGIVPVHELGVDEEGAPFYVMKLLEGSTFKESIKEVHREPDRLANGFSAELLDRFSDICNAVAYAHEQGVIHRDLKPSNIMVGQFGETIVVDWGLAKKIGETSGSTPEFDPEKTIPQGAVFGTGASAGKNLDANNEPSSLADPPSESFTPSAQSRPSIGSSITRSGAVLGTPAYMSPEQSEGENNALTPATDIYALGVILYEILTGKNPFRAKDVETTLTRVRAGEYELPRAINPRVPRALAAICTTAMSRRAEDRYEKAEQIVADLQRFMAGEAVTVYEDPWWAKVLRWCRRRPALTAGVLGSVFVLLISSMLFGAIVHRAHQAEMRARLAAEASRQEEIDRLSEAREAADAWLIGLSGSLQFFPGMEGLRSQLLEEAADHYQGLIVELENNASSDDSSFLEIAKCHTRLGDLYRLMDIPENSREHYQASCDEIIAEQDEVAKDYAVRIELTNARIGIALLNSSTTTNSNDLTNDLTSDMRWLREYLNHSEADFESDRQYQSANTFARLALAVSRNTGSRNAGSPNQEARNEGMDPIDQLSLLTEAEGWAAKLVANRAEPRDHQLLQTVRDELTALLRQTGRFADAAKVWQAEVMRLENQVATRPRRPDLLQSLAFSRMQLASLQGQMQQEEVAIDSYQLAIEDLNRAWQLTDADAYYRRNVATSHVNLGRTVRDEAVAVNHLDEAIDQLRQVVAIEGPSASDLVRLAECYESLGAIAQRHGDAIALERYNSAEKCYEVLSDHQQFDSRLHLKRALNLAARCDWEIHEQQFESAAADLDRAKTFVSLSLNQSNNELPSVRESCERLQVKLQNLKADLFEAKGDKKSADQLRIESSKMLRALADQERQQGVSETYPLAMQSLFDRLIEANDVTVDVISEAESLLTGMSVVYPLALESPDWRQRQSLLLYLQGKDDEATEANQVAMELRPTDRLNRILREVLHCQPNESEEMVDRVRSVAGEAPGDDRLRYWSTRIISQ